MPEIVLSTLNAKYPHSAFGLRYLMANLGELRPRCGMLEFDIRRRPVEIVERVLGLQPRIVGFGVYIWNVAQVGRVVAMLKRIRPDVTVVIGGPEVGYGPADRQIVRDADYLICGEADLAFADLCRRLIAAEPPSSKVVSAAPPDLDDLVLPYELYDDDDVANRVIYVEASRGCPFRCEFCLSSLDVPLRHVPLDRLLAALQSLLDRGARHLKFVDRTFNADVETGRAILEFLASRYRPGLLTHFEMVPDRLPDKLRDSIERFPPGALQFELGIQTFDETVSRRIGRRQDNRKVEQNLRYLRSHTGVHVHADLIVGLPGEDLAGFAAGFDRLVGLGPHEIQVGMLKRLHGTPIPRHDREWSMVYDACPPYEILQTRRIDFATMQRLRRFARYWDLVANSGNFLQTTALIRSAGSPFRGFLELSDWLYERLRRTHAIALVRLCELLFEYLTLRKGLAPSAVAATLAGDYRRGGRKGLPEFLRGRVEADRQAPPADAAALPRQARHWAGSDSRRRST